MPNLPVVCVFGVQNINLKSAGPIPDFETNDMDCRCYLTDDNLYSILAKDKPVVVVSFGSLDDFRMLSYAPFNIRKMWLHFGDTKNIAEVGRQVFHCFLSNALKKRFDFPLVTIITPTYKTGDKLQRPYSSLLAQTYNNWEWVIIDDSNDDGQTFKAISELANKDYRIRPYKTDRHSGVIGNIKRAACDLGRGEYLIELDHDDELTPDALSRVVETYKKYPEVGFVYSDFAECFEDGSPVTYGPGWGFGYGSYREEKHNGLKYMVVNAPKINAKTIRHIVAAPNHLRSWKKSLYISVGGHNENIHVADDYELMVRTFLSTRMALIPKMCYIQYRNQTGNAHQARNKDIQRLVRYFSDWYDKKIHDRFIELGVDDFVWQEGKNTFSRLNMPNQKIESHCTIVSDVK